MIFINTCYLGGYIIESQKVRHYVVPDLENCEVNNFPYKLLILLILNLVNTLRKP
jgi:hypothetical protein